MGDSPVSERLPAEVTVRQRVAVVGAGPAGVVTVAVLLSRGATVDWVDRQFLPAGGMGGWKEVPANTKVDLLVRAITCIPGVERWLALPETYGVKHAMGQMVSAPSGWELQVNSDPAPQGWTHLRELCQVIHSIAEALRQDYGPPSARAGREQRLFCWEAEASQLELSSATQQRWVVQLESASGPPTSLSCEAVVLAPGGRSKMPPSALIVNGNGVAAIPQEDALAPSRLKPHITDPNAPIALIGNSHSAFVIAENLYELGCRNVHMFGRRPVVFAAWDEDDKNYGEHAFGGLKGRSADFAMRHVLGLAPPSVSPSQATQLAANTFASDGPTPSAASWLTCQHLGNLDSIHEDVVFRHAVYAFGFERAVLPRISVDGEAMEILPGYRGFDFSDDGAGELQAAPSALPTHKGENGHEALHQVLPCMYGCGLAFPHVDGSDGKNYEAASIPLFRNRAEAIVASLAKLGEVAC